MLLTKARCAVGSVTNAGLSKFRDRPQLYPRALPASFERSFANRNAARRLKPSSGLEPETPLYEEGPCVNCLVWCIAQSGRALRSGAVSWAHLSIASSREDKADWSSLRWRSSLRTVRRPGGRWRLWERRVGDG